MTTPEPKPDQSTYESQVQQTLQTFDVIDDASLVGLTTLGVREIKALKQEIAEIFPASNLPAFLLQGLIQIEDRIVRQERINDDLTALFRSTKQIGLYSILAAPALVIHGYQRILALAGKDIDQAFPNGHWQFYTECCLREDMARYCVETNGFQKTLPQAKDVEAATCWVYTAMCTLLAYDDLLENEWEERRFFRSLHNVLEEKASEEQGRRPKSPRKAVEEHDQAVANRVQELYCAYNLEHVATNWGNQRPYSGKPKKNTSLYDFVAYRRECFQAYLQKALDALPSDLRDVVTLHHANHKAEYLPRYQDQMTILTTLTPDTHKDHRAPLVLHHASIALVVGGNYYLLNPFARDNDGNMLVFADDDATEGMPLPLQEAKDGSLSTTKPRKQVLIHRNGCVEVDNEWIGRLRPRPIAEVKGIVHAILKQSPPTKRQAHAQAMNETDESAPVDLLLVDSPRNQHHALRQQIKKQTHRVLDALRSAPIIVNWDCHAEQQSLSDIRRTHRGCGDHALTLIRTDAGVVFDTSHIHFDGIWSMSLAQIMTSSAIDVYPHVAGCKAVKGESGAPLELPATKAFLNAACKAIYDSPTEVAVETHAIKLKAILRLRSRMKDRELLLTVNDMLMLARCIHAANYAPGKKAREALDAIGSLETEQGMDLRRRIEEYFQEQRTINPALLIPMDATGIEPYLRIYPATFRNPLHELPHRLARCTELLKKLQSNKPDAHVGQFKKERLELYEELKTFGSLMEALRQLTMQGESFNIAAMRLLSYLPESLQHLMQAIPQKIDVLNEIIKGSEVFSNVGRVASTSSLTRFSSSRDDGDTKLMVWGVMSDARGKLVVTLRDFRPHVTPLCRLNRADLAHMLAQDYLDAYAAEANTMVKRIQDVLSYRQEG